MNCGFIHPAAAAAATRTVLATDTCCE